MKLFNKASAPALTFAALLAVSAAPAYATDKAMDIANAICANGNPSAVLAAWNADSSTAATALGLALLQAGSTSYGCKASASDINNAISALANGNPGNKRIQTAANGAKADAGTGNGDGTAGLQTTDQNSGENEGFVEKTMTGKPGESSSKK